MSLKITAVLLIACGAVFSGADAQTQTTTAPADQTIPAHTKIPIHLTQMLSSHDAQTGQKFGFVVDQDVVVDGVTLLPKCTPGSGTITLAGKHGINGHEGDLHLRFDTLTAPDRTSIVLVSDEQEFAGTNRKALAFMTSRWINGDDVEVRTDRVMTVEVASDAMIDANRVAPECPPLPTASADTHS